MCSYEICATNFFTIFHGKCLEKSFKMFAFIFCLKMVFNVAFLATVCNRFNSLLSFYLREFVGLESLFNFFV